MLATAMATVILPSRAMHGFDPEASWQQHESSAPSRRLAAATWQDGWTGPIFTVPSARSHLPIANDFESDDEQGTVVML